MARKVIIRSILGTDPATHNEHMDWVKQHSLVTGLADGDELSFVSAVLHASDIGHPVMEWTRHEKMSLRIQTEFYEQYKMEVKLGLPTIPFMGTDPSGPRSALAVAQIGFFDFVAGPYWNSIADCFGSLEDQRAELAANRSRWQQLADAA
jgi:calcium/calmodulin-dependent 3',5'-cyclic nucleotide phosphodiesterase